MRTTKEIGEKIGRAGISICLHGHRVGSAGASCDCRSGRVYVLAADVDSVIEADRRELREAIESLKVTTIFPKSEEELNHANLIQEIYDTMIKPKLLEAIYKPNTP